MTLAFVAYELVNIGLMLRIVTEEKYNTILESIRKEPINKHLLLSIIGKFLGMAYVCEKISEEKFSDILSLYSGARLQEIWFELPLKYKLDSETIARLPCFDHYNLPTDQTHIDGPAPALKQCNKCNEFINNKNFFN